MSDEGVQGDPMDAVEMAHALAAVAVSAWTMFVEFKAQGFTEQQSFDLVKAWLHGTAGGRS